MNRIRSRGLAAAAGAIAVLWCWGSPAIAEVGAPGASVQAIAADAQFLEYAPPPAAPGVVCLIDSGVDQNPDTTPILAGSYVTQPGADASDEMSAVNPRLQPGNHPDGHGTYMAMIMAAPANGWGMVGVAPTSVKVFNLKVLGVAQTTFSFAEYSNSVEYCADGPAGVPGLSVVNLSLGSDQPPTQNESAAFALAVADARSRGLDVVGSAGNSGGPVAFPAAIDGVLAVGAADASPSNLGVLCASSGRGPTLGVLAPGCGTQTEPGGGGGGIDVAFSDDGTPAWAFGSSEASAFVSAVLASMRAYDPGLTAAQAEACVTSTEVAGGNLDTAAAFRACGLGAVVTAGLSAYGLANATPPASARPAPPYPSAASVSGPTPAQEPGKLASTWRLRPRILLARAHGRRLIVAVASLPRGARLRVDVQRHTNRGYRTVGALTFSGRLAAIPTRGWDRLSICFVRGERRSEAIDLNPDGSQATAAATTRAGKPRSGP